MKKEGYPIPKVQELLPMSMFSNLAYINTFDLSDLKNIRYQSLDSSLKGKISSLAINTCIVVADGLVLGTGVLISPNVLIIAKHSIDSLPKESKIYAVFGFLTPSSACRYYEVETIIYHPAEDVALLKVSGFPTFGFNCQLPKLEFEDQPVGGFYLAHHAGGLALQISTGEFPDYGGNIYTLEHLLITDAGPLASGGGVFDGASKNLIGINTARTSELGALSRKILILYLIKDWLQSQLYQYSNTPYPSLQNSGYSFVAPPPRAPEIDLSEIQTDDIETSAWVRAKLRAKSIFNFLNTLYNYLNNASASEKDVAVPEFINFEKMLFDTHQSQHLGSRSDKTRINKYIGSSTHHPFLITLSYTVNFIYNFFNSRILNNKNFSNSFKESFLFCKGNNRYEWAIDFRPIVIGTDNNEDAFITRIDGHLIFLITSKNLSRNNNFRYIIQKNNDKLTK